MNSVTDWQRFMINTGSLVLGFLIGVLGWALIVAVILGIIRRVRDKQNGKEPSQGRGRTWLLAVVLGLIDTYQGEQIIGTWTLEFVEDLGFEGGAIDSWAISLNYSGR